MGVFRFLVALKLGLLALEIKLLDSCLMLAFKERGDTISGVEWNRFGINPRKKMCSLLRLLWFASATMELTSIFPLTVIVNRKS